jgi:hypothetical protein
MAMKFVGVCLVTRNVPLLAQFYVHVLGAQAEGSEALYLASHSCGMRSVRSSAPLPWISSTDIVNGRLRLAAPPGPGAPSPDHRRT